MENEAKAERRRPSPTARIFLVRLFLAAFVSALAMVGIALAGANLPDVWGIALEQWLLDWLYAALRIESLGPLATELGIENIADKAKEFIRLFFWFVLSVALTYVLFRQSSLRTLAKHIYNVLLAPYDDSILRPIRRPKAFDPLRGVVGETDEKPFAWQARVGTARLTALTTLIDFARTADGHHSRGGREQFQPFRCILIMGSLGSGKSRLAMEAARLLARREVWGGAAPHKKGLAALFVRWRSYWSRQGYRDDDPWDAGWLVGPENTDVAADGPYRTWVERKQMRDGPWSKKLRGWRPRRPTVLILDDPRPGDADAVVNAMHTASEDEDSPYRHPVRLIIVSPAPPDDLQIPPDQSRTGWSSYIAAPMARPIILGEAEKFGPADIRAAASIFGDRDNPLWRSGAPERLLAITHGSPLLVEIAFDLLRKARAKGITLLPEALTIERLLNDRIVRWRAILDKAGVSPVARQALAAATLAGDAPTERIDAVLGRGASPQAELLRQLFPGDALTQNSVPPLTPTLIGDAFVRAVLAECNHNRLGNRRSEAEDMIAAAWNANPSGMLASVLRLAANDDQLGRMLALDPVVDLQLEDGAAGFDGATLAQAWALAAIRVPRGDWDAGIILRTDNLVHAAEVRIATLSPEVAAKGLATFIESIPLTNEAWVVRGRYADRLIHAWLNRALDFPQAWQAQESLDHVIKLDTQWWHLAAVWGVAGTEDVSGEYTALKRAYRWAATASGERATAPIRSAIAHLDLFANKHRAFARSHAVVTVRGLAQAMREYGETTIAARLVVSSFSFVETPEACRDAVDAVDRLAAPFAAERDFALERARAWRCLADALTADVPACRDAVDAVDRLAAPFAGERDFAHERTRAWGYLAYALMEDAPACRDAVDAVDRLAAPFAGEHDFALARARAWRCLSYALMADAPACRDAVDAVDRLATPFAGERDFARERARAWCHLAYALRADAPACRDAVDAVDRLAAPFAGERDFAHERAGAWRYLAYALMADAPACRDAVDAVDRLAAPFAGERDFAHERIQAWGYLPYALTADVPAGRDAVDAVDRLAAPFAAERDFVLGRARAWRGLAYALRADAPACRDAVDAVDRLAAPFAGERDFVHERTQAWGYLAHALRTDAPACRDAVDAVDRLAVPFAGERDFAHERARAWRDLAYALRADAPACRDAVDAVDRLAAPFASERDFAHERAKAWRSLAYAVKHDAELFDEVIAKMQSILLSAGSDPQITKELRTAFSFREYTARYIGPADALMGKPRPSQAIGRFAPSTAFTIMKTKDH